MNSILTTQKLCFLALWGFGILGISIRVAAAAGRGGWRTGRATYYGERHDGSTDGFSIHQGSCMFGRLDGNAGTGWDVAALPDVHPEYTDSCGKCYELACEPMVISDNYGNTLNRTDSCLNPENTVIVTVTDTCPCNYPQNQYSNKRWCCGDMDHFDISIYAFEKIGRLEKGVIGLKYRLVECPGTELPKPTAPNTQLRIGEADHSFLSQSLTEVAQVDAPHAETLPEEMEAPEEEKWENSGIMRNPSVAGFLFCCCSSIIVHLWLV